MCVWLCVWLCARGSRRVGARLCARGSRRVIIVYIPATHPYHASKSSRLNCLLCVRQSVSCRHREEGLVRGCVHDNREECRPKMSMPTVACTYNYISKGYVFGGLCPMRYKMAQAPATIIIACKMCHPPTFAPIQTLGWQDQQAERELAHQKGDITQPQRLTQCWLNT